MAIELEQNNVLPK